MNTPETLYKALNGAQKLWGDPFFTMITKTLAGSFKITGDGFVCWSHCRLREKSRTELLPSPMEAVFELQRTVSYLFEVQTNTTGKDNIGLFEDICERVKRNDITTTSNHD